MTSSPRHVDDAPAPLAPTRHLRATVPRGDGAPFGTTAAGGVRVPLGLPHEVTTAGVAIALGVVLALWHRSEGTLSSPRP